MNNKTEQTFWQTFLKIGLFVALIAVIVQLYPHKTRSFKYHYSIGQPWSHELVMADFDFPIYKTTEQYEEEQEAVLSNYAPYYNHDAELAKQQLARIIETAKQHKVPENLQRYLQQEITGIYKQGIISLTDHEIVQKSGYKKITIVDQQHIASASPLTACYTPKSAYDQILANAPQASMAEQTFHDLNLNAFLLPNLSYDTLTSSNTKEMLLQQVAPTQGMVQAGEKIIDKGEIVTAETAQILQSLKVAMDEKGVSMEEAWISTIGTIALIIMFVVLLVIYLMVFRPRLFLDINTLLFFFILMTITIAMACLVAKYTSLSIYIVPFAWVPVIIRVFYDSRTALYVHIITILICSMLTPAPYEFLVLQICMGMVAVSSLRDMAQRAQLVQTAAWILLAYCVCYTAFTLATKGDYHLLEWKMYVYYACNALLVIFAYGLIYIFEKSFHLLSSITLVELTNINSGLMLEFAEKAPGTFQHSMQVSNLATEAAKKIQANSLLVRTGALYHDIGKMYAPQNFTENQQDGYNPLSKMDHISAARAVIRHEEEGVAIAKKHKLPSVIIQFIESHHGTSKTRYFYNTYMNEHPGAIVDESIFQYPGPKPLTKETAVVMMADAVEARSRSMSEYTEESITTMVNQMIDSQMADGQFENTPLTFKDIDDIKRVFIKKLISINHHRIAYPELNKDKETENEEK